MRCLCLMCLFLLSSITYGNYYSDYEDEEEPVSFDYAKSLGDIWLLKKEVTTTPAPVQISTAKVVKHVRLKKLPLFTVDHIIIGEKNLTSSMERVESDDDSSKNKTTRKRESDVQPYTIPKLYVSPYSFFVDPLSYKFYVPEYEEVKKLIVYSRTWQYNFWIHMMGFTGNILYSPIGIVNSLAILHLSMKGTGCMEIQHVLYLEEKDWWEVISLLTFYLRFVKQQEFFMLSKVFVDYRFTHYRMFEKFAKSLYFVQYNTMVQHHYVHNVREINEMIKKETDGKFPKFLRYGDILRQTSIFFMSLMEFNGAWEQPFSPADVQWGIFHSTNGFEYEGDVMYMELPVRCDYISEMDIKALLLPFKGGRHTMIFATTNSAETYVRAERGVDFFDVYDYLSQIEPYIVRIGIPKFEMFYEIPTRELLYFMGIQSPLSKEPNEANYRRMCNNSKRIFLNNMLQKISLRIGENGTYPLDKNAYIPPTVSTNSTPEFIIRHPFLIAIFDIETQTIVMSGRVEHAGMYKMKTTLFEGEEEKRYTLREKNVIIREHAFNKKFSLVSQYLRRRLSRKRGRRRRRRRRRRQPWKPRIFTGPDV